MCQQLTQLSTGLVDSPDKERIDCTVIEGHEMGHASRRGVSFALILGLNTAWLYAVMCASLCAAGVCPNEMMPGMGEQCHHEQAPGPNQQCPCHEPSCLWQGHPRVFFVPAGNQVPVDFQSLTAGVFPTASMVPATYAPDTSPDTSSHSPPGVSTGRTICQKESLLRI